MTLWFHYAHLNSIEVHVGQAVKRGQVIGTLGTTGWSSGPHTHYDILKVDPRKRNYTWNAYTYGMNADQVRAIYVDPKDYRDSTIPIKFDHLGYRFLQKTQSGELHSGDDLNGGGNDLGIPVKSWCDGIVDFVQSGTTGFGKHVFIKQQNINPPQGDIDTMPLKNSLTENTLKKAKEEAFIQGIDTGDGKDLNDYLSAMYDGEKLGEQSYKALISYLWNHPSRRRKLDWMKSHRAEGDTKSILDRIKEV